MGLYGYEHKISSLFVNVVEKNVKSLIGNEKLNLMVIKWFYGMRVLT